jgi:hypothetical protein
MYLECDARSGNNNNNNNDNNDNTKGGRHTLNVSLSRISN